MSLYEYKVKSVEKIYDGDTITVVLDLGFNITTMQKLRLAYIDAPELRGEERPEGLVSRDWLRERIYKAVEEDENIIIRTLKDRKGKYGRYIAEVFIDGEEVNHLMILEGMAEKYQPNGKNNS